MRPCRSRTATRTVDGQTIALGLVGIPSDEGDTRLLTTLMGDRFVHGDRVHRPGTRRRLLNVNADTFAGHLAAACGPAAGDRRHDARRADAQGKRHRDRGAGARALIEGAHRHGGNDREAARLRARAGQRRADVVIVDGRIERRWSGATTSRHRPDSDDSCRVPRPARPRAARSAHPIMVPPRNER